MNIYDSLFAQDALFNHEVAREMFDAMPCDGAVIAFFDGRGTCWANDEERLDAINIDSKRLYELTRRIDDGGEPVVTQCNGWGVIVGDVWADRKRCGYVLIALENQSPEATLAKLDLAEVIFCQFNTIAKLMGNQALTNELHMKACSVN